jgi:ABC-type multidrug transport system ATPase subunit
MNAIISLENCTKRYRDQVALHDVSLSVPPGVVFALLV